MRNVHHAQCTNAHHAPQCAQCPMQGGDAFLPLARALPITYGCSLHHIRLQPPSHTVAGRRCSSASRPRSSGSTRPSPRCALQCVPSKSRPPPQVRVRVRFRARARAKHIQTTATGARVRGGIGASGHRGIMALGHWRIRALGQWGIKGTMAVPTMAQLWQLTLSGRPPRRRTATSTPTPTPTHPLPLPLTSQP